MITGDGNLVELQATRALHHRPIRASTCSRSSEPEEILRSAAESVLREVGGRPAVRRPADHRPRRACKREVLTRLDQRCCELRPRRAGHRLDGLSLHDLHPPQEVVHAYHEVTQAMETARPADQPGRGRTAWRPARASRTARSLQIVAPRPRPATRRRGPHGRRRARRIFRSLAGSARVWVWPRSGSSCARRSGELGTASRSAGGARATTAGARRAAGAGRRR